MESQVTIYIRKSQKEMEHPCPFAVWPVSKAINEISSLITRCDGAERERYQRMLNEIIWGKKEVFVYDDE